MAKKDNTDVSEDPKPPVQRKYGLKPSKDDPNLFRFEHTHKVMSSNALPPVSTVLLPTSPAAIDQLQLGCCTGAGTSRALKNLLGYNNYKWPFMPSALDIYAKARILEGTPLTDDSGASITDVMSVISNQGVAPEDSNPKWSWPFSASDDRWQQTPPDAVYEDAALHKVIKYMKVNLDVDSIKTALFMGFPLVIGIAVHKSFESEKVAQTGVVPMPGFLGIFDPVLGYHCLRLDGYGLHDADHATGVNSWGQEWGDEWQGFSDKGRGRFHIPFKYLTDSMLTTDIFALQVMT